MGRYREVETEQQEKSYEARIWWALWAVCLVVLVATAYNHIRECILVYTGNCMEAEYSTYQGRELAKYYDENNFPHTIDISNYDAAHEGDKVLLYYKDYMELAQPRSRVMGWVFPYLGFGAGLAACSFMIYKIYKPEKHIGENGKEG